MSTDEGAAAAPRMTELPPPAPPHPATEADWGQMSRFAGLFDWQNASGASGPLGRCLWDLRRRVEALEAAGGVTGNPGHVSAAPAGVSVEELADCLPANAWAGPEGYSRLAFARHLLDHPRIGPLLRGEGAPAPKRVVLPEKPFYPFVVKGGAYYMNGFDDAWDAARAEVERQQQGGQADG